MRRKVSPQQPAGVPRPQQPAGVTNLPEFRRNPPHRTCRPSPHVASRRHGVACKAFGSSSRRKIASRRRDAEQHGQPHCRSQSAPPHDT